MARQVRLHGRISVGKPRAIFDVRGNNRVLVEYGLEAGAQRIPLVVVEDEPAGVGWREIGEAAGDGAGAFGVLPGIRQMYLPAIKQARRTHRHLLAINARRLNGNGEEEIGISDGVVIEVIAGADLEAIGFHNPSVQRNADAELRLLIALAVE